VADLCADQGIPFVLGHALYMKAIHGGKAKNDKIDSRRSPYFCVQGPSPTPTSIPARCAPPGAFSEAAVCFLQHNPAGQRYLQRLRKKHSKGKSLSVLAAKLGRATYYMLKQRTSFDMNRFLAN
jgi:hypothetical protein